MYHSCWRVYCDGFFICQLGWITVPRILFLVSSKLRRATEIVSQNSWMTEGTAWPFLPVIQSNTNLSSAVKGFCRCKSIGSKLIKREIIPCGPNLIRSSLKQDFGTSLRSETSNSSRAHNFSSLPLHLPSSLTAVNNLQLMSLDPRLFLTCPFCLPAYELCICLASPPLLH